MGFKTRTIANNLTTGMGGASGINFRNMVINGDMSVDQRNSGSSSTNTGGTLFYLDRFNVLGTASAGEFGIQQVSDGPAGFTKSLKWTVSTADASLAATDRYVLMHRVEGENMASVNMGTSDAHTTTLSFSVKCSTTGTFGGALLNGDGNRCNVFEYTISSADTWERKDITFVGDTSGTWPTNNTRAAQIVWSLGAGSDYHGTKDTWAGSGHFTTSASTNLMATNGATWQITGVQWEIGSHDSSFEHLPIDVNLQRCQRYYEEYTGANTHGGLYGSTAGGSNGYIGHLFYKVRKRTRPTFSNQTGNGINTLNNSSGSDKGGTDSMYYNCNANSYIINMSISAEL